MHFDRWLASSTVIVKVEAKRCLLEPCNEENSHQSQQLSPQVVKLVENDNK
jgi:hypothetical protein